VLLTLVFFTFCLVEQINCNNAVNKITTTVHVQYDVSKTHEEYLMPL